MSLDSPLLVWSLSTLDNSIYFLASFIFYVNQKLQAPLLGSAERLNTCMRYRLLDDGVNNLLIMDTWANQLLAKVTTIELGARICQNLNKRLGTQEYLNELRQKVLTKDSI